MIRKAVLCYYIFCYSLLFIVLYKTSSILAQDGFLEHISRNIKKLIRFRGFAVAWVALKAEYVLEWQK